MSRETFVLADEVGADGLYHFDVDMSDSLSVYDLWLYTRLDKSNIRLVSSPGFPLTAIWTSPSGQRYSEVVYFETPLEKDFYSHQYKVLYRSGLRPVESGQWQLSLDIDSQVDGLCGMGLQTVRTKE